MLIIKSRVFEGIAVSVRIWKSFIQGAEGLAGRQSRLQLLPEQMADEDSAESMPHTLDCNS